MNRDQSPNFMLIQETKMKKELLGKISFSSTMVGEATNTKDVLGGLLTLFDNKQFKVTSM